MPLGPSADPGTDRTTTVATVTETLPMAEPTPEVVQRVTRRSSYYAPPLPKYLRNRYSSSDISYACRRLVRKPSPRRTVTATRTATRTATGPSVTHTASTTVEATATELTTTTTTSTAEATETTTITHPCDQPVFDNLIAAGIKDAPRGAYTFITGLTRSECCRSCWEGSGCNGWFLFELQPSITNCGQIFNYPGPADTVSQTCASGTSDFWLIHDASSSHPNNVGALGPCGRNVITTL
jgi:hypothetical protein